MKNGQPVFVLVQDAKQNEVKHLMKFIFRGYVDDSVIIAFKAPEESWWLNRNKYREVEYRVKDKERITLFKQTAMELAQDRGWTVHDHTTIWSKIRGFLRVKFAGWFS